MQISHSRRDGMQFVDSIRNDSLILDGNKHVLQTVNSIKKRYANCRLYRKEFAMVDSIRNILQIVDSS